MNSERAEQPRHSWMQPRGVCSTLTTSSGPSTRSMVWDRGTPMGAVGFDAEMGMAVAVAMGMVVVVVIGVAVAVGIVVAVAVVISVGSLER
mmetsp:Transcript_51822/g.163839  ORF Transcript_51822/g.163839 Transcript_51822/m.163839 type:complete len:91 (+) Transcript_51822:776-1048(+)